MEFEGAKHAFHRYFGKSTHKALPDEISVLMISVFLLVGLNNSLEHRQLEVISLHSVRKDCFRAFRLKNVKM
jgi:hypothetical protein